LAGLLLDRADTAISARQLAQAQALLAAAENLIGLDPPEDLARHLADLRQELQSLRGNDQFNGAP
jgi:hypothetical protein